MKRIILFMLLAACSVSAQYKGWEGGNFHILDDFFLKSGYVTNFGWETADANANALILALPEGGGTDVPVFLIGDATLLNLDLGLYDGFTEPTLGFVDDAGSASWFISINSSDEAIFNNATKYVIDNMVEATKTQGSAAADGTRYFDFEANVSVDPAASAEVNAGYFAYNQTGGSNGTYIANALEGVFRSQFADESVTGRGVYGRFYIDPVSATNTLRTGIGGEFSARASYSGGTAITAESGTAFVGARIWMAPYFTAGSVGNVNNFWGLWIYGEHASQRNADAAIKISDAGGGFTDDIILQEGFKLRGDVAGKITFQGDGATNDEDLTWDYETVADEVSVSSTSSVTNIEFGTDFTISNATPVFQFEDTDASAGDVNASIQADATDTGNGTEDIDVEMKQQVAGALTTFLKADADGTLELMATTDMVFTPTGTEVHIDGGLSVGDETDVGDNNFKVVGTSLLVGTVTVQSATPTDIINDNSTTGADANSGHLILRGNDGAADTELQMSVMLEVNTTTDYYWAWYNDDKGTEVGSIDESGNLQIDGIFGLGGGITITMDDPFIYFDPSTASESEWWIGTNHDVGGADNDNWELRQSATPGTAVEFYVQPDGDGFFTGDLTITGDDLFMATNTTGYILRADNTNYNPVKFDDSSDLAGFLDDETGTGLSVFGTAPVFASTITIGTNTGTSGQILFIASDNDQADIAINTNDQITFNNAADYIFDGEIQSPWYQVASTADNTETVNHNFGYRPFVWLYVTATEINMEATIDHTDVNTFVVTTEDVVNFTVNYR